MKSFHSVSVQHKRTCKKMLNGHCMHVERTQHACKMDAEQTMNTYRTNTQGKFNLHLLGTMEHFCNMLDTRALALLLGIPSTLMAKQVLASLLNGYLVHKCVLLRQPSI